jgi:hypothetical protein
MDAMRLTYRYIRQLIGRKKGRSEILKKDGRGAKGRYTTIGNADQNAKKVR